MSSSHKVGFFQRLFHGQTETNSNDIEVAVGDRFFQVSGSQSRWVIERLSSPNLSKMRHVVIRREGSQPLSKTISLDALFDPNHFKIDRRDPDNANAEKPVRLRRRTDKRTSF